jgi:uncharacterized surface protein with fasciclin (FAS1) repeats
MRIATRIVPSALGLSALALGATAGTSASASAPPATSDGGGVDCAEIAENLDRSAQLTTFVTALESLPDEVAGGIEQPFTLFVPTDDVFDRIPPNVVESILGDPALAAELVLYHLVPGAHLTTDDLVQEAAATTATGAELTFAADGDTVSLNGGEASIVCPDLADDEGIIVHVLDGILRPPSMGGGVPGSSVPGSSVPASSVPGPSFDADQQAVATVWETVLDSASSFDEVAPLIENSAELQPTIEAYATAAEMVGGITARVTTVTIDGDDAAVKYIIAFDGVDAPYGELEGALTLVDGSWIVPQSEYCAAMASARNDCPAA